MANRQLQLKVKAINQRYVDLFNQYGHESEPVREYQEIIKQISTHGTTKSNYLAIKKVGQLNENDIELVNKLYKFKTKSMYNLMYKQTKVADSIGVGPDIITTKEIDDYERENGEIDGNELRRIAQLMNELHDKIITHKDMIYRASQEITEHLHRKRGENHLSLSEVADVLDIISGKIKPYSEKWDDMYYPGDDAPRDSAEYFAWARGSLEYEENGGKFDNYDYHYKTALSYGLKPYKRS